MKQSNALTKVIKETCNSDLPFEALTKEQKVRVLTYIYKSKKKINVYGKRWFDIISNTFFVEQYFLESSTDFRIDRLSFETFDEFYNYLKKDIYHNSCFYGYKFYEQQIRQYNIEMSVLNFDSFIDETIDDYPLRRILTERRLEHSRLKDRISHIKDFISSCGKIKTKEELNDKNKSFNKHFGILAGSIFVELLINRFGKELKDLLIQYILENKLYHLLPIVFFEYGSEDAKFLINHCQKHNKNDQRLLAHIKNVFAVLTSKRTSIRRKIFFDKAYSLYCLEDDYINPAYGITHFYYYFISKADLNGFTLKLPIPVEETKDYVADSIYETNFEEISPNDFNNYKVLKYFEDGSFHVKQQWAYKLTNFTFSYYHHFDRFFDFVHFLNGNLEGTDFIGCKGIENLKDIKNLRMDNIISTSKVTKAFGLDIPLIPPERLQTNELAITCKNESETGKGLAAAHVNHEDGKIAYISDLHLIHRLINNKCETFGDIAEVLTDTAAIIKEQAKSITIIAGDISSDIKFYSYFVNQLNDCHDYFITLGNHEFWSFVNQPVAKIVSCYKEILSPHKNLHLVHNNIFYYANQCWYEITTEELERLSELKLRELTRNANLIIFGGIGFSGLNQEFNANVGLYRDAINRQTEIEESEKCYKLYLKVTTALHDKNLIVVTHMPLENWAKNSTPKEGIVYISGHTHRNYFFDDGKKRIYADNQIGYRGKSIALKYIDISLTYDYFSDYKDGIYEISKEDYMIFLRGCLTSFRLTRRFDKIVMIKHDKAYMLFAVINGVRYFLSGAQIYRIENHTLEYFYDKISNYTNSIKMFISKYREKQQEISDLIKSFGGSGTIHGCIIDIDFFCHIYLNILDGKMTPYYAEDIVDKYVYDSIDNLLKQKVPELYETYKRIEFQNADKYKLFELKKMKVAKKPRHYEDTEMYMSSAIMKKLQFQSDYNIVRVWDDDIAQSASIENGEKIIKLLLKGD